MATATRSTHALDTNNYFKAFISGSSSVTFDTKKFEYGQEPKCKDISDYLNEIFKQNFPLLRRALGEIGKLKEDIELWNDIDTSPKELLPSLEKHQSALQTMNRVVELLKQYRNLSENIKNDFTTAIKYFERKIIDTEEADPKSELLQTAPKDLKNLKYQSNIITKIYGRFVKRLGNIDGYLKTFEKNVSLMENPPKGWFESWFGNKSSEKTEATESTAENTNTLEQTKVVKADSDQ